MFILTLIISVLLLICFSSLIIHYQRIGIIIGGFLIGSGIATISFLTVNVLVEQPDTSPEVARNVFHVIKNNTDKGIESGDAVYTCSSERGIPLVSGVKEEGCIEIGTAATDITPGTYGSAFKTYTML
jgi:hypothetical protein